MAGTVNPVTHAWYPGQAAVGIDVHNGSDVFTGPVTFQGGIATQVNGATIPYITAPGTVASAGTVTNSTGFDAMVYMSATTGISKVVFSGVPGGTIAAGAGGTESALGVFPVYWPNNQGVAVTYTGTLTWTWLAI
jgi:hypothetical protein